MGMQNAEQLRTFMNAIHPVEEEAMNNYLNFWKPFDASRRTILTRPEETERYMYFVLDGIQKSYYQLEDKQHVIAFTYPPSFSGIPESFLSQTPSRYFLECISEGHFLRITYENHQKAMQEYRSIETLFRKATELILGGVIQRHHELMALTIEQRFKAFVSRSPHLFNTIPQKDIASYLRIDPTNLSKLLGSIRI